MNKDNSLERFEITKLLLWLCLLLILIFTLIATLIIPNVNKIKINNEKFQINNAALNSSIKYKLQLSDELDELKSSNKTQLDALYNDFDMENFKYFAKNYFENVEIEEDELNNEEYLSYKLFVSTKIESPVIFYDFIDSLSHYNGVIRVDFPIIMESLKDLIRAQFNIKVYISKN